MDKFIFGYWATLQRGWRGLGFTASVFLKSLLPPCTVCDELEKQQHISPEELHFSVWCEKPNQICLWANSENLIATETSLETSSKPDKTNNWSML